MQLLDLYRWSQSYNLPMSKTSVGLLMYRQAGELQALLVHPGGPFWKNKDAGAWTIPKGELETGEEMLAAARREFREETGLAPTEPFLPLGEIKQKGGKIVHAWAFEGDCDPAQIKSNTFSMEWPPKSGRQQEFPEVDCAEFFTISQARDKIIAAQIPLLERLEALLER